jgi:hypothetical protein
MHAAIKADEFPTRHDGQACPGWRAAVRGVGGTLLAQRP